MGAWNLTPWGNDKAVEWFNDFFKATQAHSFVEKVLYEMEVTGSNHEQVRAAISVILFLGRPEIWPIDSWHATVEMAIKRLDEIMQLPLIKNDPDFIEKIQEEKIVLKTRLETDLSLDEKMKKLLSYMI
jgi:hypothetical protein